MDYHAKSVGPGSKPSEKGGGVKGSKRGRPSNTQQLEDSVGMSDFKLALAVELGKHASVTATRNINTKPVKHTWTPSRIVMYVEKVGVDGLSTDRLPVVGAY